MVSHHPTKFGDHRHCGSRVFQIVLRGWGGGFALRIFFQSFEAFVMLKLICHIY